MWLLYLSFLYFSLPPWFQRETSLFLRGAGEIESNTFFSLNFKIQRNSCPSWTNVGSPLKISLSLFESHSKRANSSFQCGLLNMYKPLITNDQDGLLSEIHIISYHISNVKSNTCYVNYAKHISFPNKSKSNNVAWCRRQTHIMIETKYTSRQWSIYKMLHVTQNHN